MSSLALSDMILILCRTASIRLSFALLSNQAAVPVFMPSAAISNSNPPSTISSVSHIFSLASIAYSLFQCLGPVTSSSPMSFDHAPNGVVSRIFVRLSTDPLPEVSQVKVFGRCRVVEDGMAAIREVVVYDENDLEPEREKLFFISGPAGEFRLVPCLWERLGSTERNEEFVIERGA